MREIIFKPAEKRELGLSENVWDSREMRETWQVWVSGQIREISSPG